MKSITSNWYYVQTFNRKDQTRLMKYCLIYTVKNDTKHFAQLIDSLTLVRDNLSSHCPNMDILFFCDPGAESHVQNMVKYVGLKNNVFILAFEVKPPAGYEKTPMVGYKNMCQFWAREVFKHSKVLEYDYFMRLDCDSFITAPVNYNPFTTMDSEDKDYAFLRGGKFKDTVPYYEGINAALQEFEDQFPEIMKNSVSTLEEGTLYYTNFEICRIRAFSESLYINLVDHINRVQGIYKHRWGDHIIRYAGIHMILGFDNVKEITDISYEHQRFVNGIMV